MTTADAIVRSVTKIDNYLSSLDKSDREVADETISLVADFILAISEAKKAGNDDVLAEISLF